MAACCIQQPYETHSITPTTVALSELVYACSQCFTRLSCLANTHTHTRTASLNERECAQCESECYTATLRRTCIQSHVALSFFRASLRSWLKRSFDFSWQKFLALCGPLCALTFLQTRTLYRQIRVTRRFLSFSFRCVCEYMYECVCLCMCMWLSWDAYIAFRVV